MISLNEKWIIQKEQKVEADTGKKRKRNKFLYTALVHISEKPIMGMVRGTPVK